MTRLQQMANSGTWSMACNGNAGVRWFTIRRRTTEPASSILTVRTEHREVEVYISPAGRSVRIFVDGEEVRQ